ncbi:MAG TPA: hypothetical protein VHU18_05915 [Rhizomicrobium sp.]|nr:hypothetical protein [Rhizomicrobium sp.]
MDQDDIAVADGLLGDSAVVVEGTRFYSPLAAIKIEALVSLSESGSLFRAGALVGAAVALRALRRERQGLLGTPDTCVMLYAIKGEKGAGNVTRLALHCPIFVERYEISDLLDDKRWCSREVRIYPAGESINSMYAHLREWGQHR